MSEQNFKEARGNLSMSQKLIEELRGQHPQIQNNSNDQEVSQDLPGTVTASQQDSTQASNQLTEAVKAAMEPYMKQIEELIVNPKEAVLKVEGSLEPKSQ